MIQMQESRRRAHYPPYLQETIKKKKSGKGKQGKKFKKNKKKKRKEKNRIQKNSNEGFNF